MTIHVRPDGTKQISWVSPGEPVDWTTPDSEWRDHQFCGNCGLDVPGCGCPRNDPQAAADELARLAFLKEALDAHDEVGVELARDQAVIRARYTLKLSGPDRHDDDAINRAYQTAVRNIDMLFAIARTVDHGHAG